MSEYALKLLNPVFLEIELVFPGLKGHSFLFTEKGEETSFNLELFVDYCTCYLGFYFAYFLASGLN